jgi:hypothetical protein
VFRIYTSAGCVVQIAVMVMEFKKLRNLMPLVELNTTAAQEQVGEIECKIRVIKERVRLTFNMLPYQKKPNLIVIRYFTFA